MRVATVLFLVDIFVDAANAAMEARLSKNLSSR